VIAFDIETGPLPEAALKEIYQEPTLEEFAATCDKRWKPETVAAKYEEAKGGMWAEFVAKAALSPLTGRVLAIGFKPPGGEVQVRHLVNMEDDFSSERNLLSVFWRLTQRAIASKELMVGHNILGFDLPFLLRRSWLLGVEPTEDVFDGRYWHRCFTDTMKRWQCGSYQERFVKLDAIAKAFGVAGKLTDGGVSGAEFSRFYWGSPEERQLALEYLVRDVEIIATVAGKMGVI
jgi:3'-5' exonuclease